MRLAGKTAVITGAGSGIGAAAARLFAQEGARVVVADRRADEGAAVVGAITAAGGDACFVPTDVSRRADNERLLDACLDRYGRLDILYCNAGISMARLITDSTDDDLDALFDINVKGLVYATRYAIPIMLRQGGGAILITASKTGLVAQRNSPL